MAWRDPATIDWSNGAAAFFYAINEYTLGWASRLILIGIYVIVLTGYFKARDDFAGGLAAAGIAVFIVALSFFLWNFVDWISLAISIGVMIVGAAIVLLERQGSGYV